MNGPHAAPEAAVMQKYVLDDDGNPVPCADFKKWASWFEKVENLVVARDVIGSVRVSTVFLGFDYPDGGDLPVLWETMVFGGEHDEYQERYTSRADALEGHAKALEMVKSLVQS